MVSKIRNNKAQVTIFVIIAIVIIVAVGLVFYLTSIQKESEIPEEPTLENIPTEFKPIRTYVENCIQQIADQGTREMAKHGGYIDPLDKDYSYFDFDYNPNEPTESELVSVSNEQNSLIVPYWYYLTGLNTCDECGPSSLAPTIGFMEAQLSLYIQNNLADCLGGFSGLVDSGFDINVLSNPVVETIIHEHGQNFLLNYELEASKDGATQIIKDYFTQSSLPLKKLYTIAYNLTMYESTLNGVDSFTKYLVSIQTGPSMDMLPPFFYQDDSKIKKYWFTSVVKEKIKQLLFSYTQILQVMGTRNFDDSFLAKIPDELTMEKTLYLQGIMPIYPHDSVEMKNYSVSMNYLNHPIYVEVWPHDGERIMPNEFKDIDNVFLPKGQSNYYRFFYDISYPLIVEVKNFDVNNKNNEMNFFFALEINIRKNKLVNDYLLDNGPIEWDTNNINVKFIDTDTTEAPVDPDYKPGNKAIQNMFCNPQHRLSGNISLFVYDKVTGKGLNDVLVSYGCGTYAECALGKSDSVYSEGYFNSKMPLCLNGYVSLEKIGYKTERVKLSTIKDQSDNIGSVGLYPVETKNVSINKIPLLYKIEDNFVKDYIKGVTLDNNSYDLTENESAIIRMTLIDQGGINSPYLVFTTLEANNSEQINLVPGKYAIDIMYLDNSGVTIPKECEKKCSKGIIFGIGKKCVWVPPNEINFAPAPWGGLDFNESNPISLRPSDIYNKNNSLELYLITYPEPNKLSCLDSLNELSKKTSYTLQYRSRLVPKFFNNAID